MLRIGLLGASRIAPKALLTPARERDDVEITAVAARDGSRARAYAAEHGIAHAVEGYAALLERDDIDAVYNALPPAEHLEWSVRAAGRGLAQLCEKPFALSAAHARTMADAASAAGRPLMEAMHSRFHHAFLRAEALVAEGALGRVTRAHGVFDASIPYRPGELRWIRPLGGGSLMDLGCYPLHALRTLLKAEPQVLSAELDVRHGVDAAMRAHLRFGEVEAQVACSMVPEAGGTYRRLTLEGERARLDFDNFVSPQNGGRLTLTHADGRVEDLPVEGPSSYAAQLDRFVAAATAGADPLTGGADAVAQMTAIDAIYAAGGLTPA